MSEKKSVEPGSQPEAISETPSVSGGLSNESLTTSHLVSISAAGLIICFFLPWATWFGLQVSGFDLQKINEEQKLLWAIPFMSLMTIMRGLAGSGQRPVAQIAGSLPFFALGYWVYKLGTDVTKILNYGAYLSLILGAMLFILPRRSK